MTAQEFRDAINALGHSQRAFARLVGANERTVHRWASGHQDIPGWVPVMLQLMRLAADAGLPLPQPA